jgi:hypothetical protein
MMMKKPVTGPITLPLRHTYGSNFYWNEMRTLDGQLFRQLKPQSPTAVQCLNQSNPDLVNATVACIQQLRYTNFPTGTKRGAVHDDARDVGIRLSSTLSGNA